MNHHERAEEFLTGFDAASLAVPQQIRDHYIGMSAIGSCAAELWRNYHKETSGSAPPKLRRVFDLGHSIESLVLDTVPYMGGIDIISTQAEYRDFDGRLRGHSDLVFSMGGLRIVSDVKSMNDNSFKWFGTVGIKRHSWKYWCQLQMYAGYEKADAVQLIAYNKNTSEIATQFCDSDPHLFEYLQARALMILEALTCPKCEKGDGRVKYCGCNKGE